MQRLSPPRMEPPRRQLNSWCVSCNSFSPASYSPAVYRAYPYPRLQENLSLDEKRPPPPYTTRNGVNGKNENVPPRPHGRMPQLRHQPTRSAGEDERRRVGHGRPRGPPPGERNIFDDPPDRLRERRPRRNSESSAVERSSKLLDPEDDKRRHERRRREARHREHRSHKTKGPSRRMDIIDKLDVTSIYGTGRKI